MQVGQHRHGLAARAARGRRRAGRPSKSRTEETVTGAAHVDQQAGAGLQVAEVRGGVPVAEPGRGRVDPRSSNEGLDCGVVAVGGPGRAERGHAGRGQGLDPNQAAGLAEGVAVGRTARSRCSAL